MGREASFCGWRSAAWAVPPSLPPSPSPEAVVALPVSPDQQTAWARGKVGTRSSLPYSVWTSAFPAGPCPCWCSMMVLAENTLGRFSARCIDSGSTRAVEQYCNDARQSGTLIDAQEHSSLAPRAGTLIIGPSPVARPPSSPTRGTPRSYVCVCETDGRREGAGSRRRRGRGGRPARLCNPSSPTQAHGLWSAPAPAQIPYLGTTEEHRIYKTQGIDSS